MSSTVNAAQPEASPSGSPPTQAKRRMLRFIVLGAVLCLLLAIGIVPRIRRRQAAVDQVHASEDRITMLAP